MKLLLKTLMDYALRKVFKKFYVTVEDISYFSKQG
jgi:hypothetical protein